MSLEEVMGNPLKAQNWAHHWGMRLSDHVNVPLKTFKAFLWSLGKIQNPKQGPQSPAK